MKNLSAVTETQDVATKYYVDEHVIPISKGGTGVAGTVGSATRPVYMGANGLAVCTHSLEKSVPSNAVFTDTTALGSMTGTLAIEHGGTGVTSAKGSATQPVYLGSSGVSACTYSLEKSVPSNAVFTDTTNLGSMTGTLGVRQGGTGVTWGQGSATQPVYLSSSGVAACTYSLNQSVPASESFVEAEGDSGIWHYRKYQNGWAECWGENRTSTGTWSQWGSVFEAGVAAVNFPFTFTSVPKCYGQARSTGSYNFLYGELHIASTTQYPASDLVRGTNGTTGIGYVVDMYVVGRWK